MAEPVTFNQRQFQRANARLIEAYDASVRGAYLTGDGPYESLQREYRSEELVEALEDVAAILGVTFTPARIVKMEAA